MSSNRTFRFHWHGNRKTAAVLAVICIGLTVAAVLTEGGPWSGLAWIAGALAVLTATEINVEGTR